MDCGRSEIDRYGMRSRRHASVAEIRTDGMSIAVAITGAAGRMGREVVRAVLEAEGLSLVAAVDRHEMGADAGTLAGCAPSGIAIEEGLNAALDRTRPDVL